MMSPRRMTFGVACLTLILLASVPAFGQDGVRDLPAAQLFDPADIRPYGEWDTPKEGFFASFDGIFWTISAPKKTSIGAPGQTRDVFYGPTTADEVVESNTMDTGDFRAKQTQGDRIEFGYTGEHHGFLVDTFELNGQTQYIYGNSVSVVFNDPPNGVGNQLLTGVVGQDAAGNNVIANVPVNFTTMSTMNRTFTDGVEVLYTYRQHPLHYGGELTWMAGARYVRFDDEFAVDATGGNLAESAWDTTARNRIYGPEVGVRYIKQWGRFSLSTEGRFMAGVNNQDIRQYGELASELTGTSDNSPANTGVNGLPLLMHATAFASSEHLTEFTPLIEFRVEGHVQLTRLLSLKAGWTGIFMDGIARASDMVEYTVPSMGILPGNNNLPVFIQGVNVGLELNR